MILLFIVLRFFVSRVAELLRGGRIMDTVFEPYEAHVPFLTQVSVLVLIHCMYL